VCDRRVSRPGQLRFYHRRMRRPWILGKLRTSRVAIA
jgi:hypothetical protein